MTAFEIHTEATAPEAAPILAAAKKKNGFVPNLYGAMAEAPALLEGYVGLAAAVAKTSLTPTERQIVLMVNNRLNGCGYCMSAHTAIAKGEGVPDDVIEGLRSGATLTDPKLEALRTYAIKVNETRGWPDASDVDALLAAGYDRRTMLEVVLCTALKVMSNYTNHVAETPLDKAFAPVAWSEQELVENAN